MLAPATVWNANGGSCLPVSAGRRILRKGRMLKVACTFREADRGHADKRLRVERGLRFAMLRIKS